MHDNKVSDKVIWEGNITSDEEISFSQSNIHSQPQMMFCYNCNNVIPGNSTFCPYCQIKLFTECPKCGASYSSQYPSCSQCGTNRQEYFAQQQIERERKEAIEREQRRRREIEERKRVEEEYQRKKAEEERELEASHQRFLAKEAIRREQDFIKAAPEFKEAYAYLCELNKRKEEHNKEQKRIINQRLAVIGVLWIIGMIFIEALPDIILTIVLTAPIWCLFVIGLGTSSIKDAKSLQEHCPQTQSFKNILTQEIVNKVSEYIATHRLNLNDSNDWFSKENLTNEIIKAYKSASGRQ